MRKLDLSKTVSQLNFIIIKWYSSISFFRQILVSRNIWFGELFLRLILSLLLKILRTLRALFGKKGQQLHLPTHSAPLGEYHVVLWTSDSPGRAAGFHLNHGGVLLLPIPDLHVRRLSTLRIVWLVKTNAKKANEAGILDVYVLINNC